MGTNAGATCRFEDTTVPSNAVEGTHIGGNDAAATNVALVAAAMVLVAVVVATNIAIVALVMFSYTKTFGTQGTQTSATTGVGTTDVEKSGTAKVGTGVVETSDTMVLGTAVAETSGTGIGGIHGAGTLNVGSWPVGSDTVKPSSNGTAMMKVTMVDTHTVIADVGHPMVVAFLLLTSSDVYGGLLVWHAVETMCGKQASCEKVQSKCREQPRT